MYVSVCVCERSKREGAEERIQSSQTVLNGLSLYIVETEQGCENGKEGVIQRNDMFHKRLREWETHFSEYTWNSPSENSECIMILMCATAEPRVTFLFLNCLNVDVSNSWRSWCTVTNRLHRVPQQSRCDLLVYEHMAESFNRPRSLPAVSALFYILTCCHADIISQSLRADCCCGKFCY